MKVKELLTEGLDKRSTYQILLGFIEFAARDLELTSLPKFDFAFDSDRSVHNKSFGGYMPGGEHITITVKNRHIMDVCRTLAHEMVHVKQYAKGQVKASKSCKTHYWMGKHIRKSYYEQPWEVEAFTKERVLANKLFAIIGE